MPPREPPRRPDDFAATLTDYQDFRRRLRWRDVHLVRPRQVHLHGKGRKDRILPLWPDTGRALRRLLALQEPSADAHVFCDARGEPLGRDGTAYILTKYLDRAAQQLPVLRRKHVTPHVLRHNGGAELNEPPRVPSCMK
jgi:integrase